MNNLNGNFKANSLKSQNEEIRVSKYESYNGENI